MSAAASGPIVKPILLICEGSNDAKVFRGIFRSRGLDDLFQVEYPKESDRDDIAGVTGFNRRLRLIAQRENAALKAVLLVADEDKDGVAQFSLVQNELRKAGMPIPEADGQVVGSSPPVCIHMLPGCLETLVEAPLGRFFNATDCIASFEACSGAGAWENVFKRTKMRVRSALALWEDEPRTSLGRLFDEAHCEALRADLSFDAFADRCRTFASQYVSFPTEPPPPS